MIERKGKYIPGNVYNKTKERFIKNWKAKSLLGLDSSDDTLNFTNHEISESNIKCNICIIELWNDMSKNRAIERTTSYSEGPEQN